MSDVLNSVCGGDQRAILPAGEHQAYGRSDPPAGSEIVHSARVSGMTGRRGEGRR